MATRKDGIDLQFSIATKEANENLRQLSSQVTTLNKSLGVTDETMKGTGKSVENYQKKISDLNKQKELLVKKQEENEKMLKLAISSYGDASKEARKWTNEILDNEKKLAKVNNEIDKTEDQMQEYIKTNKDAEKSNEKLSKSLDNAKESFTVFKGVIADLISSGIQKVFSEISGSIDGAIDRLDTMNNFPKVMANLGISAKESEKAIKELSDGLQGLPTTLDEGALAVQRFTSKNGDVQKSTDLFLALNNAILAGGAGTQIQSSALEQLSQAYAKGKPDMMEWRTAQMAMPAQLKQIATQMLSNKEALEIYMKKAKEYADNNPLSSTAKELVEQLEAVSNGTGDMTTALGTGLRTGIISMEEFMDTIVYMNKNSSKSFKSFEEQAKNSTSGIKTSMTNLKTAIVRGVSNIIEQFDKALKNKGLGGISKIIGDISKKAGELFKEVGKWMPTIINVVTSVFNVLDKLKPIIIAVVSAFVAYKSAVTVATTAMGAFNAILNANPLTLVIGAISALIGLFVTLANETDKSDKELQELKDSMEEYSNSMEQIAENREKFLSKGMAELDHYDDLYRELQLIVDENGKIKEGYEERAEFITTSLSEALGIEIEIVDGQIQKYDELGNTIQDVIQKKKDQLLLEAHEEEYKKALEEKKTREEEYGKAVQKNKEALENYNKQLEFIATQFGITSDEAQKMMAGIHDGTIDLTSLTVEQKDQLTNLYNGWYEYASQLDDTLGVLEEEGELFRQNQEIIYNYDTALEALETNNRETFENIYKDTVKFTGKTVEDNRKKYEEALENDQNYLDDLIKNQDKYSEDFINSEKDRIAKQEEQWQIELEKANNNLENQNTVKVTKTIEGINKQLEAIDGKKYEFRDAGNGNVQLYVDGIEQGQPIAEHTAQNLTMGIVGQLNNGKVDAEKAGQNLVEGVQIGINEKKGILFNTVTKLGQNVLASLKSSLNEHSPSKTSRLYGQYLLQGLNLGIKDESKESLKTISDFGNQVLNTFGNTVSNVSSEFDSIKLNNIITPQLTQEVTEKATTIRETRPIILNIDTFNNNTDRDIESLSNELAFYVRQKEVTG